MDPDSFPESIQAALRSLIETFSNTPESNRVYLLADCRTWTGDLLDDPHWNVGFSVDTLDSRSVFIGNLVSRFISKFSTGQIC